LVHRVVCFACENSAVHLIPEEVCLITLPCSGRVEVRHVLRAVREGADAVLVLGCLEGNCRYHIGTIEARRRVAEARELLVQIGAGDRVMFRNLAPNHPARVKRVMEEVNKLIDTVGRNPLGAKK
jgi:F420-non-reducing hydrogenase iron-sulfur subunit